MRKEAEKLLQRLAKEIRKCRSCPLWKTRTKAVSGEGGFKKKLFFVGEAPGRNEDLSGKPFCGIAGRFFDKMLGKAYLSREDIFVTGAVKCRPPHNRKPKKSEIEKCKPFLLKQIKILKPRLIVLLGKTALEAFQIKGKLSELHGKLINKDNYVFFLTFHPAAAMRFPKIRELSFRDMKKLGKIIRNR